VTSVYTATLLFAGLLWVGPAVAIATAAGVNLALRHHVRLETWLLCRGSRMRRKIGG